MAEHAYKAGAGLVTPLLSDPRWRWHATATGRMTSFDKAAGWLYDGMGQAFDANTARLAIVGDDPMLLAGRRSRQGGARQQGQFMAYTPARERITNFAINWNIISWPGKAWAQLMFPDLPEDEAVARLAQAIFRGIACGSGRSGGGMGRP
jgi:aminopeptidase